MKKLVFCALILLIAFSVWGKDLSDAPRINETYGFERATATGPMTDEKTHQIGNLYLTITNWGFFGSQRGDDDPRYCYTADEEICGRDAGNCRPSAEYPGCSGIEYLFQGALWVGAVIAGDTLVSVGEDGWLTDINELFPSYNDDDTLIHRSTLDSDSGAVSEDDYVGNLSDTVVNTAYAPPDHRPIGIAIHQESYAWSYNYANNFVFIDYIFNNIRDDDRTIRDMYIGLYIDGDVGHVETPDYAQDDITGFIKNYVNEANETTAVNLAWLADNDGDPDDGMFTETSPTGAMAVKLLRGPTDSLNFSFNWWISNTDEVYDWGPMREDHQLGFDGTPEGDISKYKVMSNNEFDYDQTATVEYFDDPNWRPSPNDIGTAENIANGYDTRFLLSFGPIEVQPNLSEDSLPHITIAFMVGENFHQNPNNTGTDWAPNFNFDKLSYTAYWAQQIFDNDYHGPEPPPSPEFIIVRGQNKVTVLWKSTGVEDVEDNITNLHDFEGYRVYIAEENIDNYYIPLVQYDEIDYLHINEITEILDSVTEMGDTISHYNVKYSDTLSASPDLYTATIIPLIGIPHDTTLEAEPFSANNGMPPDTTYEGETWYYFEINNLLPGDDKWVVVTAFDYGQPSKELESLESNKTVNAKWFVSSGTPSTDKTVKVVPNPYRVDMDYKSYWEHSFTGNWTEYSRKIRFYNLPKKCQIRIFTLDGDLVKKLDHDESDPDEMVGAEDWNLISRNDQATVSGIYIFSVEDKETGETQTGKFVIIK
ncbi:hypothetical protein J7L68_03370 [bacterium]|nr:hypothetical protein [bacterium]